MARVGHTHQVTKTGNSYWHYLKVNHRSIFGREEHNREISLEKIDVSLWRSARLKIKELVQRVFKYRKRITVMGVGGISTLILVLMAIPGGAFTGEDVYCGDYCETYFNYTNWKYDIRVCDVSNIIDMSFDRAIQNHQVYLKLKGEWVDRIDECVVFNTGMVWEFKMITEKDERETIKWTANYGDAQLDPLLISEVIRPNSIDIDLGNDKRQLIIGGQRYAKEDRVWKAVEESKSLYGVEGGYDVVYLEQDPNYVVNIHDFNYTWISFNVESKEKGVFVRFNGNEMTKSIYVPTGNYEYYGEVIGLDNISFGKGSTTIILQDNDTENLDDTHIRSDHPTYGNGAATSFCNVANSSDALESLLRFNITSVPDGSTIDDSILHLWMSTEAIDSNEEYHVDIHHTFPYSIYNISDDPWEEGDEQNAVSTPPELIYDERPISGEYNTTYEERWTVTGINPTPDAPAWVNFTTKQMVTRGYDDGDDNITMWLKSTYSSGTPAITDDVCFYSKEWTDDTSLRPYLNITYSEGDTSPPTIDFVSATKANLSSDTNGWFFINVSADEDLNHCFLNVYPEVVVNRPIHNTNFEVLYNSSASAGSQYETDNEHMDMGRFCGSDACSDNALGRGYHYIDLSSVTSNVTNMTYTIGLDNDGSQDATDGTVWSLWYHPDFNSDYTECSTSESTESDCYDWGSNSTWIANITMTNKNLSDLVDFNIPNIVINDELDGNGGDDEITFIIVTNRETADKTQDVLTGTMWGVGEDYATINNTMNATENITMTVDGDYCYYNASVDLLPVNYTQFYFRVYGNDSAGNLNVTEDRAWFYNDGVVTDTCTYGGSGDWHVDCADNCLITSDVDLGGNDLHITGDGEFGTTAAIQAIGTRIKYNVGCKVIIYSGGSIW